MFSSKDEDDSGDDEVDCEDCVDILSGKLDVFEGFICLFTKILEGVVMIPRILGKGGSEVIDSTRRAE